MGVEAGHPRPSSPTPAYSRAFTHPRQPALTCRLYAATCACAAAMLLSTEARAQQPPAPPQTSTVLQPTLSELRSTIAGLHIAKWKAPGPVKDEALGNAGSINRDLENTLPALLQQADATPQSVANTFAVYRNFDALYEVLLRVSGTAELAAPDEEAANLAHSLVTLDAARRALADSILSASRAQELALQQARQPPPTAAALPPPASATVVDDGPTAAPAHRKPKAKPKPAPQATPQTWLEPPSPRNFDPQTYVIKALGTPLAGPVSIAMQADGCINSGHWHLRSFSPPRSLLL